MIQIQTDSALVECPLLAAVRVMALVKRR